MMLKTKIQAIFIVEENKFRSFVSKLFFNDNTSDTRFTYSFQDAFAAASDTITKNTDIDVENVSSVTKERNDMLLLNGYIE